MKTFKFSLFMIISAFSCAGSIEETGSILEKYDFNSGNQIELIPKLNEISDLTLSNDGNILAITDEIGVIYKINPLNGEVLERFFLGRWTAEADFEGLANSGKNIYAVSSEGILYKFIEGESRQREKVFNR